MVAEGAASRHMIVSTQGVEGVSQIRDAERISDLDILSVDADSRRATSGDWELSMIT